MDDTVNRTDTMTVTPPPADTSTRLAVDRTRLAYERTMMAWIRTAASLISFGFTIYKFFELELKGEQREGLIGSRGFALLMITTGLISLLLAGLQHSRSLRALRESYGAQPRSVAGPVAWCMAILGIFALLGVIVRA
jgi:putative membrane protein